MHVSIRHPTKWHKFIYISVNASINVNSLKSEECYSVRMESLFCQVQYVALSCKSCRYLHTYIHALYIYYTTITGNSDPGFIGFIFIFLFNAFKWTVNN